MKTENKALDSIKLIDKLKEKHHLTKDEWIFLIDSRDTVTREYLFKNAVMLRQKYYKNDVYIRGLIEFTNYCKNDCYYCGIRASNRRCERYRLTHDEIIECCTKGYELGFRTFVLQGGEDPVYTPDKIECIIRDIKSEFPDCAFTLSFGEYDRSIYQKWFDAGADRYLLRHETADKAHYEKLHPEKMSYDNRMRCLKDLKDIGYQVGCGFMVGSPFQTSETLAKDMMFISSFKPDMIGIGPFIPAADTPFGNMPQGTLEQTLFMLALLRLTLPKALIPATTALGTIHPTGRELGIEAGANVCMPNLSPTSVRKKYALYDNKICTGDEAAECKLCLSNRMARIGYKIVASRGDRYGFL